MLNASHYFDGENASLGMKKLIAEAKSGDTIFFDKPGTYHFYKELCEHRVYHMTNTDSFVKPDKYFAILIEDKENITIDGNGSTLFIHGDICALALVRCKNIVLKNFRITYNAPTNFELTAIKRHGNKITYSLPVGTSFDVRGNSVYFYEKSPLNGELYYEYKNNSNCYCNVMHRENEVYRTQLSPIRTAVSRKKLDDSTLECKYVIPPNIKIGDTVAMSQNWCRDNCGIFFWECSNVISESIDVNYMHGFGWLSQMCEDLTFNNIRFTPDRERGYKVSSFADCIHICGCKGYVSINDCLFEHPHDDGINIHGAFLRYKNSVDDHTAVFEFVHKQQGGYKNFFKGDKVKLYSRLNLAELDGIYTVADTKDDIDNKLVTITFDEKLPDMKSKMVVAENISYNPKVTIKGCTFKNIPTRGILCTTTEQSEIYGNTFTSLKMPDIYISCDCKDWYESGPCKAMKIYNNHFSQKNPVKFEPICVGRPVKNVHENIEIFDNYGE